MEALVRVARSEHGTGMVGQGWVYRVSKTKLRLRIEGVLSKGLGTNSGQREVWIRVPVRCYTECNTPYHQFNSLPLVSNSAAFLVLFSMDSILEFHLWRVISLTISPFLFSAYGIPIRVYSLTLLHSV